MFEKFGEFDSVEELNEAAAGLLEKGDKKGIEGLAKENGIDMEDARDYISGDIPEFASVVTAAFGKLDVESSDLKIEGVLKDWVDELKERCMSDEKFARAVRKKGKDLCGYIALTADTGYKNRVVVDKRIVGKCKEIKRVIGNHEFSIGIPNRTERKALAEKYYL